MKDDFNINIKTLIQNNLSFEAYFILYCLYNDSEMLLLEYTRNCRKIPTIIFTDLRDNNYISINEMLVDDNKIIFKALNLTTKGKSVFVLLDTNKLFEEFRQIYPKSTPSGRKLHQNLKKCESLYSKIIGNDLDMHKILCKCAKLYVEEKIRTNGEDFYQLLQTWLNQENYKVYIDEINNVDSLLENAHSDDI